MIIPDVNVLINALHTESPRHAEARAWLTRTLQDGDRLGLLDVVATGVVRIMTNARVFKKPLSTDQAIVAIETIMRSSSAVLIHGSSLSWEIFSELTRSYHFHAADIPDAWIAANVIAEEATLVSDDKGFARFGDLDWVTVSS